MLKWLLMPIFVGLFSFACLAAQDLKNRPYLLAPVEVDSREVGTLYVYPKYGDRVGLVEKIPLLNIIKKYLDNPSKIDNFQKKYEMRFVSFEMFSDLGVKISFDEDELIVRLAIKPQDKASSSINLLHTKTLNKAVLKDPSVSGYANFFVDQPFSNYYKEENSFGRDNLNISSDIALNIGGVVLDSGFRFEENSDNDFERNDTKLIKDFENSETRAFIGEHTFKAQGFQVEETGLGVTFERDNSFRPDLFKRGSDSKTIVLKEKSEVEVVMNGSVIHKNVYSAGPVDFSNFPFSSGTNRVLLRVTNNSGKVETVEFEKLYSSELLKAEALEFNATIDSPQYINDQGDREYSDVRGSGWFMYGVNDSFSIGGNAQYFKNYNLYGLEQKSLFQFGVIETSFALSRFSSDRGMGARIVLRNHDLYDGKVPLVYFRSSFEFREKDFLQLGQTANNIKTYSQASLSARVFKTISIGLGGGYREFYLDTSSADIRLDLSSRLFRNWTVNINLSKTFDNKEDEFKTTVGLSWYPRKVVNSVNAKYDSLDDSFSLASNATSKVGSNSLTLDGEIGAQKSNAYFDGGANLSGNRGEVGFEYSASEGQNYVKHKLGINGEFGVAFSGTSFAFGKPVFESFAIVDLANRPSGLEIPVTIGQNVSDYSISAFGPALIPSLSAYQYYEIGYDLNSLPSSMHIDENYQALYPKYKRGNLISSTLSQRVSAYGIIISKMGPLSLLSGEVLSEDKKVISTFFTNKKGRFFVEQVPSGSYFLRFDSGTYDDIEFNVKNSASGLVDFGVITATKKKSSL